ncbi:MAG: hypothetical protein WAP51_01705 [Candidatus Sungiibacteriota bacterium]
MRTILSLMVAVLLALFGFNTAMSAELPAELSVEIQSLNNDLTALKAEEKTLFAEQTSLKAEEKRLIDVKELLDGAVKNFNTEAATWKSDLQAQNAEAARQRAEAARQRAEVADHNSRCSGSSSDQSFVNACNARAGQLNSWGSQIDAWKEQVNSWAKRVDDRKGTLIMKENGLKERYADLQRGVLDWTKRKKENNYQLNELPGRKQILNARFQAVLADLARRNALSQECKAIAEKITPGDARNPDLNTPMERAHRCLQRVWDGAK